MSTGRSRRSEAQAAGWRDRLDDPDEPLFTVAVVAELLDLSAQSLRRLGEATSHQQKRPSGNQRRYSRHDIEALARAAQLSNEGHNGPGIAKILDLERKVADLTSSTDAPAGQR